MKLLAYGWERYITTRKLFDFALSEARVSDEYKPNVPIRETQVDGWSKKALSASV